MRQTERDLEILEAGIANRHQLARFQQERRHHVVHDVAVVIVQILDGRRLGFVGEEEDAGPIAPEHAMAHGDSAHRGIGPIQVA